MRDLPVVKVDGVMELEHAVVDGIDVSGSWNRMFTQRSITDYPTEAMDWVTGLDGRRVDARLLPMWQVRPGLPGEPRRRLRSAQAQRQGPSRQRPDRRPGSLAVHDLRQLLSGLPQGGEPAPDHAGDP